MRRASRWRAGWLDTVRRAEGRPGGLEERTVSTWFSLGFSLVRSAQLSTSCLLSTSPPKYSLVPFSALHFIPLHLPSPDRQYIFLVILFIVPIVNNLIYCLCPLPEWKLHEAWVFYFLLCVSSALKTAHIGGLKNIWLSDWKPGPSPAKRCPVFSTHTHIYTKTHIHTPFIRLRRNQL